MQETNFGMYDQLTLLDSPVQIAIVLLIALLVFGPNKLPEIGRQLGGALRELRKAKDDMMRQFTLDHEPDPYRPADYQNSYKDSNGYSNGYDTYSYQTPSLPPATDLTDYTIVGKTPVETPVAEPNDDYAMAANYVKTQAPEAAAAEGSVPRGADAEAGSKEETNV